MVVTWRLVAHIAEKAQARSGRQLHGGYMAVTHVAEKASPIWPADAPHVAAAWSGTTVTSVEYESASTICGDGDP